MMSLKVSACTGPQIPPTMITRKGAGARDREESSCQEKRTWCADFLIRRGQSHHFLGEYFRDDSNPVGRRRWMMQMVHENFANFSCGVWVHEKLDTHAGHYRQVRLLITDAGQK